MRDSERALAQQLAFCLDKFDASIRALPGIKSLPSRNAFIEQLVESIRRIRFVTVIRARGLSTFRSDPATDLFDPLRAAMRHQAQGNIEEAFWLVFIFVHFGKHRRTGWRLARDIYGALGGSRNWDWKRTSSDPKSFRRWLASHETVLQGGDGIPRHFGNHRKYETLKDSSSRGTGKVVESYVNWVAQYGSHLKLVQSALSRSGNDPRKAFHNIYMSMDKVISFGRTARFDYLTMVGKLGLAAIEPGSTYMQGATGPLKGARLLFGTNSASASVLDAWLVDLQNHLKLSFGMQVLEDALCNWQKSPKLFKPFRG